jgi:hypothetical protein
MDDFVNNQKGQHKTSGKLPKRGKLQKRGKLPKLLRTNFFNGSRLRSSVLFPVSSRVELLPGFKFTGKTVKIMEFTGKILVKSVNG